MGIDFKVSLGEQVDKINEKIRILTDKGYIINLFIKIQRERLYRTGMTCWQLNCPG